MIKEVKIEDKGMNREISLDGKWFERRKEGKVGKGRRDEGKIGKEERIMNKGRKEDKRSICG